MSKKSLFFKNFNFKEEINLLVKDLNTRAKEFISFYFDELENSSLTEEEELILIDFAIQTIKADEQIEYSEIKFFKNIRRRLKVSNEIILENYNDIELFLEEDIITDSYFDKLTKQYLEEIELPPFNLIDIDANSIE